MISIYYKRSIYIYSVTVLLLGLLVLKIMYLCVFKNTEYTKAITTQSTKTIGIETMRKNIYDRNMIPLTNKDEKTIYLTPDLNPGTKISNYRITMPKRYPDLPLATHIVGYSSIHSEGLSGVEKRFYEMNPDLKPKA